MKNMKNVYILSESYKDGDREQVGAYDSVASMVNGFAKHVAYEIFAENVGSQKTVSRNEVESLVKNVASELARLIPRIIDPDFDNSDECRLGNSVFSFCEMPIESARDSSKENC